MINRARCREIHQALDAVMEKFAKEHGMAFTPGSARYNSTEITFNIKISEANADGSAKLGAWEQMALDQLLKSLGKKMDDIVGHTFRTSDGHSMRVTGYRPGSKYCWCGDINSTKKVLTNRRATTDYLKDFAERIDVL